MSWKLNPENRAIYFKAALLFVFFSVAVTAVFYLPYRIMRTATIEAFNDQQELLAKQAAEEIERLFRHFTAELTTLAGEAAIIHLNSEGKKNIYSGFKVIHRAFTTDLFYFPVRFAYAIPVEIY